MLFKRNHMIDFLFPIALLFVFAASSFVVILLAANIYGNTSSASTQHYETRTPISYVTEKIHQTDETGAVSVGTFDEQESLILSQMYGEKSYTTYIYMYNHKLMELFVQDGVSASAQSGTEIMDVTNFHVEETSPNLFHISCESSSGQRMSSFVSVLSLGGDR